MKKGVIKRKFCWWINKMTCCGGFEMLYEFLEFDMKFVISPITHWICLFALVIRYYDYENEKHKNPTILYAGHATRCGNIYYTRDMSHVVIIYYMRDMPHAVVIIILGMPCTLIVAWTDKSPLGSCLNLSAYVKY